MADISAKEALEDLQYIDTYAYVKKAENEFDECVSRIRAYLEQQAKAEVEDEKQ